MTAAAASGLGRRRVVLRLGRDDGRWRASLRLDVRTVVVVAVAMLGIATAAVVALLLGEFPISAAEVAATLVGQGSSRHEFVVFTLRMPRILAALLVGAAFAMAGAILQSLARNPLVAPDVIGINSGAALLAVGVIVLGMPGALVAPAAFTGAVGASALLYVLAHRGGLSPYRLVLMGIALNAGLAAGISYLLTYGRIEEVHRATVWLLGSVYGAGWDEVRLLAVALLVLGPAAVALGWRLEALQLGDDLARAVGAPVERSRALLVLVAITLAALAVAVAGPVAFVAFIAPHIARHLVGRGGTGALVAAAPVGALLVLVSDMVAQRAFAPSALPVGIVTAILGAPYFLYLLRRAGRPASAA